jgi:hypothetical protein
MVTDIPAHVTCCFQSFERSIAMTDEHFNLLEGPGPFRASDPYRERSLIAALLRTMPADERQNRDLIAEYDRISKKLVDLERKRGAGLRNKLARELRYCLDSYHAGVCCMRLGMMDFVAVSDPARRHLIGVLLEELRSDNDLSDIEETLAALDDAFLAMKVSAEGEPGEESVSSCPECDSMMCRCSGKEKIPEE